MIRGELLDRRRWLLAAVASSLATACREVPKGGVPQVSTQARPAISRRLLPNEILPADLDVVVRVDVERIEQTLGPRFEEELLARYGKDDLTRRLLSSARTLTVGLRAADLERGDHVIVVEGDPLKLGLEEQGFVPSPSTNDKVQVFVRSLTAPRDGTDAVLLMGERTVALVSPIETDAVLRIVREGPDEQRGQPVAEGLVSADLRPKRLPAALERRYPSFSLLVAQVQRIRLVLKVSDDGLRFEGEIVTRGDAGADKIRRFLDVFREGASGEGTTAILKKMKLEKLGAVVRVTSALSIAEVAGLLAAQPGAPADP